MPATIIISIFFVVILVFMASNQRPPVITSAPTSYVPPPATTKPAPPSLPAIRPLPLPSLSPIPAAEPEELKPPIGTDLALTISQVRYCAFQGVRIEGARSVTDDESQYEVDRLNALIRDFNGRCSSYRYQVGTLERARAEADARRLSLEQEGSTAFLAGRVRTPSPFEQPSTPAPQPAANPAPSPAIPENAELNAAGHWVCNRGFRQLGAACVAIPIPENAKLDSSGQSWTCLRGFFRSGDGCLQIRIPANAELDNKGQGWRCNPGFRQIGNSCLKF